MFRSLMFLFLSILTLGCEPKFTDDCETKQDCFVDEICAAGTCVIGKDKNNTNNGTNNTTNTNNKVKITKVVITPEKPEVFLGKTIVMSAELQNAEGVKIEGSVTWTSSDETIATIDSGGLLTSIKVGEVTIKAAHESGVNGSTAVKISNIPVAEVKVDPKELTMDAGTTSTLNYEVKDSEGNVLTNRPATWTSTDESVITVDDQGIVTGVNAGKAVINVKVEGVADSTKVTVVALPIETIELDVVNADLQVGSTLQLVPTAKDKNNNVVNGRTFVWTASEVNVASVDANGLVSAKALGTSVINVEAEGKTVSATINVVAVVVDSVEIGPMKTFNVVQFSALQLTAKAFDSSNNPILGRTPMWSSSDTNIATIDSSGTMTLLMPGTITLTLDIEGKTDTATVTITPVDVGAIAVTNVGVESTVVDGATLQLKAELKDAQGNIILGRSITWVSDDTLIATIDMMGLVTGVAIGTTIIRAVSGGKEGSYNLTVEPGEVATLSVTPSMVTLNMGTTTATLVAVGRDARNNVTPEVPIWTTSDANVATVNASGLVTRVAAGSAVITATIDAITATSTITVSN